MFLRFILKYIIPLLFLSAACSTEIFTHKIEPNFETYPYEKVAKEIHELHQNLFIVDMHADSLIWPRDLTKKSTIGHVDIPRLIEGNVAIQTFAVPSKFKLGWFNLMTLKHIVEGENICTWFSLQQFVVYKARRLHSFEEKLKPKFRIIKSKQNLQQYLIDREKNNNITAGILAIEGAHALEENLSNIKIFANEGYRIIGLTHLFDNEVGGSSYGEGNLGITLFGINALIEMEKNNILIDLAHASPLLLDEVLHLHKAGTLKAPLIVSHTGVIGVSAHRRNLSDKHIIEIAKTGGVICIGYFTPAIPYAHPQLIAESIYYTVKLLDEAGFEGVHHVGLGSDFDGGVVVPFDTRGIILITEALLSPKYNFTTSDIQKIMGGNMVRVLMQVLPQK